MDREEELIRHQMDETRQDLRDKLEALENQVMETVQDTTEAVSNTIGTVKDTVESVQEAVENTVASVKETVKDTVQSVRETLDVNRMVREHPWAMVGCAVATGYVGGRLLNGVARSLGRARRAPRAEYEQPPAVINGMHPGMSQAAAPQRSWLSFLGDTFGSELSKLKNLAIGVAGSLVTETLTKNAPPEIAQRTSELIHSVVQKLGGEPLHGPILERFTDRPKSKRRHSGNGPTTESRLGRT